MTSLPSVLSAAGARHPNRPAVVTAARTIGYRELVAAVEEATAGLAEATEPGARIAIDGDVPEVVTGYLAALAAGRVAVMLEPDRPDRLALARRARVAATWGRRVDGLDVPHLDRVGGGAARWADGDDVAQLLATSGTTGHASLVAHRASALLANAEAHAESLGLDDGVRQLVVMPFFHAYALTAQLLASLLRGGTLVCATLAQSAGALPKLLAREPVSLIAGPPLLFRMLARWPAAWRAPLDAVTDVSVGAAPLRADDVETIRRLFARARATRTYGLTEAGPRVTTLHAAEFDAHWRTVGRPLASTEVTVVDDLGAPLPPHAEGRLVVAGPGLMERYWDEPSRTEDALTGGRLDTGDLGYLDDAGRVVLTGRRKEIILCGGHSLSPMEIEDVLVTHPDVDDAIVIGEDHPLYGQVPAALVEAPTDVDLDAVAVWARDQLGALRAPRAYVRVDALPRTPTGKRRRGAARELWAVLHHRPLETS